MASKYHKIIFNLVRATYPEAKIREEQNVWELVKNAELPAWLFSECVRQDTALGRLKIDIYIVGQCCIEVHGEQHYKPINFSNDIKDPEYELKKRQALDAIKQTALKAAGIPTIVIKYDEVNNLTQDELRSRITSAMIKAQEVPIQAREHAHGGARTRNDAYKQAQLKKAREARKARYKRTKEWMKKRKK